MAKYLTTNYRRDITFREFWNKTSNASDYLYLNQNAYVSVLI